MPWLRGIDSATWRIATWTVPLVFQLVLALLLSTMWIARRWLLGGQGGSATLLLFGAAVCTVVAVATGAIFLMTRRTFLHGVGLASAASAVAILIVSAAAAVWIVQ
ncbi:hypothetical protein M2272_004643 [Mycobacterium frederiksbergense]|uniref:Uncharacterized protein n=1 Tax=Mycolicibacterium frederiksbergense TaxID=117567 RepID=A0ABT6L6Z0_9MYCO|nr:hypothetical protein [Mycolicibacterium frederiksbergense]